MLNATKDITEKDLVLMRYRQMQQEQAVWNARKQQRTEKVSVLKWIFCFIVNEDVR